MHADVVQHAEPWVRRVLFAHVHDVSSDRRDACDGVREMFGECWCGGDEREARAVVVDVREGGRKDEPRWLRE